MGVFRDAMDEAMALRGLAPRTRATYLHWVGRLVRFCRVAPDRLTTEEVRAFLLDLTQERKLAFSTFNQALNAVRFFFPEVLKRPFVVEGLRYQKQPRRLPVVMNDEEVSRLLGGGSVAAGPGAVRDGVRDGDAFGRGDAAADHRHRQPADGDQGRSGQGAEGPVRDAVGVAARDAAGVLAPGEAEGVPVSGRGREAAVEPSRRRRRPSAGRSSQRGSRSRSRSTRCATALRPTCWRTA